MDNTPNKKKAKDAIAAVLIKDPDIKSLPAMKLPWTVERVISAVGYEDVRIKLCEKVLMHTCP